MHLDYRSYRGRRRVCRPSPNVVALSRRGNELDNSSGTDPWATGRAIRRAFPGLSLFRAALFTAGVELRAGRIAFVRPVIWRGHQIDPPNGGIPLVQTSIFEVVG